MVFAIATLISALSISCVAAYFSIIGLATIFPGSTGAVITMGVVLEVGKNHSCDLASSQLEGRKLVY